MFSIRMPTPKGVPSYKSKFGPNYHFQPNIHGTPIKAITGMGMRAAGLGGVALGAVIFFASGIPRIQQDILGYIPGLSKYYEKDLPASDNPF
ncbi:hypothetical protein PpBr36_02343 [Pyricularia pennisetigena]|uniref:hypothetical protein n=1 Tax=Pyricularia pennisetigena TaxID=1578925 RepID=UPI00114DDBAF|nr:hypothetical protein PpBr36_02343 [Pyricularia pennisetigena]TLS30048.1 hypothetical protein PpBr36_02343 [Pyricularia pennisetigena]